MRCEKCDGPIRETFDVKDRLIIFTYDPHWTEEMLHTFMEQLQPVALDVKQRGAAGVIAVPVDVTISSLNEHELAKLGLRLT